MADDDLRALERAARDARDNASIWIRYVRALAKSQIEPPADLALMARRVRAALADSPAHVLLEPGDEVWVEERYNPFIVGKWRGVVMAVRLLAAFDPRGGEYLQFRVRPILPDEDDPDAQPLPFRVKLLPEQRARGIELHRSDRLELIARRSSAP